MQSKRAIGGMYPVCVRARPFAYWRRLAIFALALMTAASATGHGASAQSREPNVVPRTQDEPLAKIRERRLHLFDQMMAEPANLDIAFEYAMLSSKAGDLEAATSTLERMLIFAPDVPRLRLELGVLYFRLGSYELASSNFERAIEGDNVPLAVRSKVERYLAAIEERTAINRFSGTIMFGTRYDTNANNGAESRLVELNGLDFILNDTALADDDVNGFVSGEFHYSHDLASQGDRFDIDLTTYGALYANHDEINTALGELRFGPVFNLERFGLHDAEIGVYGILGGVALRGDPYRLTGGAGLELAKRFGPRTRGRVRLEYRYQDFRNSALRPTAANQTGDRYRFGASLRHRLTGRLTLNAFFGAERHMAASPFESHRKIEGAIGASYRFNSPFESQARPWIVGLSAGVAQREYDDPDPAINATDSQHDTETFVRGTLTVPLRRTWSMRAAIGFRNVDSNYDIDTFNNTSVSIGIAKSF